MDERTWTLRVTSTGVDDNRVSVRRHQFVVGRPVSFDVEHGSVTALEYAFGSLGAEIVGGLRTFAKKRRIDLVNVEAVVTGELDNPLTWLEVVGEHGAPRISRVAITVYLSSHAEDEQVRRLWDDTLDRLPLVKTFRDVVDLDVRLTITS
jgi:hypothetical protein